VAKKGQSRRADRVNEWAVSVRLNDGKVLFWCGEEAERRGQDWAGESQAFGSRLRRRRSSTPPSVRPIRRRGSTGPFVSSSHGDSGALSSRVEGGYARPDLPLDRAWNLPVRARYFLSDADTTASAHARCAGFHTERRYARTSAALVLAC